MSDGSAIAWRVCSTHKSHHRVRAQRVLHPAALRGEGVSFFPAPFFLRAADRGDSSHVGGVSEMRAEGGAARLRGLWWAVNFGMVPVSMVMWVVVVVVVGWGCWVWRVAGGACRVCDGWVGGGARVGVGLGWGGWGRVWSW